MRKISSQCVSFVIRCLDFAIQINWFSVRNENIHGVGRWWWWWFIYTIYMWLAINVLRLINRVRDMTTVICVYYMLFVIYYYILFLHTTQHTHTQSESFGCCYAWICHSTCMLRPTMDSIWWPSMRTEQICHSDDIENVSMRVVARRLYWCYPVAIVAYNAFPHSRSRRLGIHDAQVPTGL